MNDRARLSVTLAIVVVTVSLLSLGLAAFSLLDAEARLRGQKLAAIDAALSEVGADAALRVASNLLGPRAVVRTTTIEAGAASVDEGAQSWSYDASLRRHARRIPIAFDGAPLQLEVLWNARFGMAAGEGVIALVFVQSLLSLGAAVIGVTAMLRRHLKPLARDLAVAQREAVIARGAQSIAHDLRKPYGVVRAMLDALRRAKGEHEAAAVLRRFAPELDRNLRATDELVAGLLEYSRSAPAQPKVTALEPVVLAAVRDCVLGQGLAGVELRFDFRHGREVFVEEARFARAVANVVGNALQATGAGGSLWLETREVALRGRIFVDLVIGNGGSFIPEAELSNLFTPFYTRGKRGGTGLGLAIVEKILGDAGGAVRVRSDRELGTEFVLTVPTAEVLAQHEAHLPKSSDSIIGAAPRPERATVPAVAGKSGAPLVIVLDDDPFFLDLWSKELAEVEVLTFLQPRAMLEALRTNPRTLERLALVVTDYFFDNEPETTGDHVATGVAAICKVPVMICSNIASELPRRREVVAYLDKKPRPWPELRALISVDGRGASATA